MSETSEANIQQAISFANAGDKAAAKKLLTQVVQEEPSNSRAWYLLSQVVDTKEQTIYCLEKYLKLKPNNQEVKKRLSLLLSTESFEPVVPESKSEQVQQKKDTTPPIQAHSETIPSQIDAQTKKCPYCAEIIQAEAIVCRFCGRDLATGLLPISSPLLAPVESNSMLLDRHVEWYVVKGWQVVNRTQTTAQLKKPKEWAWGCLVFFVVIPLIGGLIFPALFGVAVVALLLAVVDYALRKDQLIYLTEEALQKQEKKKALELRQREEAAKHEKQVWLKRRQKLNNEVPKLVKQFKEYIAEGNYKLQQISGLSPQQIAILALVGGIGLLIIALVLVVSQ